MRADYLGIIDRHIYYIELHFAIVAEFSENMLSVCVVLRQKEH